MLQQIRWGAVTVVRSIVFMFSLVLLPLLFLLAFLILILEKDMPLRPKCEKLALELRETIKAGLLWVVRHT